jgi:predicted ATPase/class 3 adenylate cyclase
VTGALPTGTVTFLFTDVEGSTRLLEELGADAYAVELARHRDVVRRALDEHGGVEVDTQGDAFFCAFGSARSAVACAADVQDALASGVIRVRMGIHTGEALAVDRHYVGMDVHRAARIGACGHGGQVVLSPSTVALLEPGEFDVRELGAHRLKDLTAPVVLSQLGVVDYPPLKALFRTNLPIPATPFLGREGELSELVAHAREPGVRVLTLTGPGGTGKTRLALQLAAELSDAYPDGVWWVPLAPLRDGALVGSAVAGVLDVDEEPSREITDTVASALARRRLLLIADNCEHVIESAARLVGAVARSCPDVLVVATSREPLAVAGENVFSVQPLISEDAVELFHARAHAAGARIERVDAGDVVTELCARLDNLPLAVELAAARAAALSPAALLERLSTGFGLLRGPRDVDERQRTLRATIAWSYDLLEDDERQVFSDFAVFVGGAALSAIESVCEADLEDVLSLAAKSLVRQSSMPSDEARYFMLETIREFAAEELESSGRADEVRARHLEWFADLARASGLDIERADSGERLARLELDLDNLRAALAWSEQEGVISPDALAIAKVVAERHFMRGRYVEAEEVVRSTLALGPEDPLATATLWDWLGRVVRLEGRPDEALDAFRRAERTLAAVSTRDETWWERWLTVQLSVATLFYFENAQDELASLVGELGPLVEQHGSPEQRLDVLHLRGQLAYRLERYALSDATEELIRETYRTAVELGDPSAEFTLGFCLLWRGKLAEADECFVRGREVARSRGIALIETRCLVYDVIARRRQNDVEGSRALLDELLLQDELHGYSGLTSANLAWLAYRDGDLDLAVEHAAAALADWKPEGRGSSGVFAWTARFPLLGVELARGRGEAALEHAQAMLDPALQPLPADLADLLERAVETAKPDDLAGALELAHSIGYA